MARSDEQASLRHLRKELYRVEEVPLQIAKDIVTAYHYSRGGSNTRVATHGLINHEDEVVGVTWWIPPTKAAGKYSWPSNWRGVLSLSRLAIADGEPTNAASFLLGRSMRLIQQDRRWECLVTYADTWRGHTGAIYLATNWQYAGKTRPEAVWVNAEGRMVARKAGPKTRTNVEMAELGYRCLGRFAKHRFRFVTRAGKAALRSGKRKR